jgi:hypothetical protein
LNDYFRKREDHFHLKQLSRKTIRKKCFKLLLPDFVGQKSMEGTERKERKKGRKEERK